MKEPTGALVKPVHFTRGQRRDLLKAFGNRPTDQHEQFVDLAREVFEQWRSMDAIAVSADRYKAEQIQKHAQRLTWEIDRLTDSQRIGLTCELQRVLFYGQESQFADLRYALAGVIGKHGQNIDNGLYNHALDLLRLFETASASVLDRLECPSGPNRGKEKLLIRWLADAWRGHFGSPPPYSKDTRFSKFVIAMSKLDPKCHITTDLIRYTLGKKRGVSGTKTPQSHS